MKLLKNPTTLMISTSGKLLKIRPDTYVEPLPNTFMVEVAVEAGQSITLPTPNLGVSPYVDLSMQFYNIKGGSVIASDENSGGNNQPMLTRSLSANTEYYIRITGYSNNKEGQYNIAVTGDGTAVPTSEVGVTSLVVGTTLVDQYQVYQGEQWYKFKTTAAGNYTMRTYGGTYSPYNYDVDWSDGTITTGITTYNAPEATHVYSTKGTYVIYITGNMPGWSVNNTSSIRLSITKCISWGEVNLRKIDFYGCTALTNLPEGQTGKLAKIYDFTNFCNGCTSLVGIPYGTFLGTIDVPIIYATSFSNAFNSCYSLRTIPATTFRDANNSNSFSLTFANCTSLINLPDLLFSSCYRVTTWGSCFTRCISLASIPPNLFYRVMTETNYANIVNSSMVSCFANDISLTSIPFELFSSAQIDNLGINKVKSIDFSSIFANCTSLVDVPDYIFHNQIYCVYFSYAFSKCTSLVETPKSCFEGCVAATGFGDYYTYLSNPITGSTSSILIAGVFGYCSSLVKVRDDCFKECGKANNFSASFINCINLTTLCPNIFADCSLALYFQYTFSTTKISSWNSDPDTSKYQLDPDIFKYNVLVTTFYSTFSNNLNLIDIPESLFFNNPKVSNFSSTFYSCPNITHIPPKLFRYNTEALYFGNTFDSCTGITKIPIITEDGVDYGMFYFNTLVNSFYATFARCRLTDTIDGPAIPSITFRGNTEVMGNFTGSYANGSFSSTFLGNTTLQSVPDELFINCKKATDFSNTFSGCTSLVSIPARLFSGTQNADLFANTFQNVPITSIPDTLFQDCLRASSFSTTFSGTKITEVPSLLFSYAGASVQNFNSTFLGCLYLTKINADVFKYNSNVQLFQQCFYGDTVLYDLPVDLFRYNVTCSNFTLVFYNCTSLVDLPYGIFKYNTGALNFSSAFYNCNKLKLNSTIFGDAVDKATKFLGKNMNFTSCFYRTTFAGALDLYMTAGTTYNGAPIYVSDNVGYSNQPQITYNCLANTEYYVKITVATNDKSGLFDIVVTGAGTALPSDTPGVTSLIVGTTLMNEAMTVGGTMWYKFKTTTAGSYVIKTLVNNIYKGTAPDLWNYTFSYTPATSLCFGTTGNNIDSILNYSDIPAVWKN